jgi:hypothetical protein
MRQNIQRRLAATAGPLGTAAMLGTAGVAIPAVRPPEYHGGAVLAAVRPPDYHGGAVLLAVRPPHIGGGALPT